MPSTSFLFVGVRRDMKITFSPAMVFALPEDDGAEAGFLAPLNFQPLVDRATRPLLNFPPSTVETAPDLVRFTPPELEVSIQI
jgi:hypothetical protein